MKCQVIINKDNNTILEVLNQNGEPSKLYNDLKEATNDEKEALSLWRLAQTDSFINTQGTNWLETAIEPNADTVIEFDKRYDNIRREANFTKELNTSIDEVKSFLFKTIEDIQKKINDNKGTKYAKNLQEQLNKIGLEEAVKEYNKADTLKALLLTADYNINEISKLRTRIKELKNTPFDSLEGKELEKKERELVNALYNGELFLQSYIRVQDLDLKDLDIDNISELEDRIKDVIAKSENSKTKDADKLSDAMINKKINELLDNYMVTDINDKTKIVINIMKDYQKYVDNMKNSLRELRQAHIERQLKKTTTNPKLINDIAKFADEVYDENGMQVLFDALADTHVPLIANMVKLYNRKMYARDEDVKNTTRDFNKKFNSFKKAFGSNYKNKLDLLVDKNTGKFTQKYSNEFKDTLDKLKNELFDTELEYGDDSDEYLLKQQQYYEWLRNNTVQEFTQEWVDAENLLTPEARVERIKLYKRRNNILEEYYKTDDKGNRYYNEQDLTNDERRELWKVNSELKQLGMLTEFKNGKMVSKTGKDLRIAKSIQAYNDRRSELNMSEPRPLKVFTDTLSKVKGDTNDFMLRNTYRKLSDEYYKAMEKIGAYSYEEIQPKVDELNDLKSMYRKEGDIIVEIIPKEVLDRMEVLHDEIEAYKKANSRAIDLTYESEAGKEVSIRFNKETTNYGKLIPKSERIAQGVKLGLYERSVPVGAAFTQDKSFPKSNYLTYEMKDEFKSGRETRDEHNRYIPSDKYITNRYKQIQNDKKLFEFYEYITDLVVSSVSHYDGGIIKDGYLPAINNKDASNWELLIHSLGYYDRPTEKTVTTNLKNEVIKYIPLNFIKFLNYDEKPYYISKYNKDIDTAEEYKQRVLSDFRTKYPDVENINTLQDIRNYNKQIKDNRIKAHAKAITYDIENIIPAFVKTALNHKYKSEIRNELLIARESLASSNIIRKNGVGKALKEFNKFRSAEDFEISKESANNSNILKHYDKWLDMVFYENFEKNEGLWTKLGRVLQNITSARALWLNVFSGINNVAYGTIQGQLEAVGGYFFKGKDWLQADKDYFTNIMNILADVKNIKNNTGTYHSVESALIGEYQVMENQDEKAESLGIAKGQKAIHKMRMLTDSLYILQHAGEHMMQNKTLFAMLRSHRLVNGKIMSFTDFKSNMLKQTDITKSKEANDKIIQENNEKLKDLNEKFQTYPTIKELYKLNENNELVLSKSISKEQLADFKQRVISVNQKMHGIYNKADAGTIQHVTLGRLAMQFRKWLPEGLNKRFYGIRQFGTRNRFDWNERRGERKEGMFISTFKLLSMPYKNFKERNNVVLSVAKTIVEDFKLFAWKNNLYWHSLDETQKANVRRTMLEFIAFLSVLALTGLTKALGGDLGEDDEETWFGSTYFYNLMLYQLSRLKLEIVAYTPWGISNEGAKLLHSPAAAMSSLETISKLVGTLLAYPFTENREYTNGRYAKMDKAGVQIKSTIPLVNQVLRWQTLKGYTEYFKLK
jgi:hypothetical protein